jgi:PIN domain nuclease of toxin-antitoxin system
MNYLLDTHVFLWMLSNPGQLTPQATTILQNPNRTIFVSAVSGVEIAIKQRLGKLEAPKQLGQEITRRGLVELPLKFNHGERLRSLPDHHQDPFDRMLIAQALEEKLILITHDKKMKSYGLTILWT